MAIDQLSNARQAANLPYFHFSVKDYGAVGDGVTDDTDSIQNCIDEAGVAGISDNNDAYGAVIHFPPGLYLISDTLELYGGTSGRTHLRGSGSQSTTIKLKDGANADMIHLEAAHAGVQAHLHGTIRDLRLDGNRNNQSSTTLNGIKIDKAGTGFEMRNIKIDNISGYGVNGIILSNVYFQHVNVVRCTKSGYYIHDGNNDCVYWNHCETADCDEYGVFIDNVSGSGGANFVMINKRFETSSGAVTGMFDNLRLSRMNGVNVTMINPHFQENVGAPAGTYTAIRIDNADVTQPRLSVTAANYVNMDNALLDNVTTTTIAPDSNHVNFTYNIQNRHYVNAAADKGLEFFDLGDTHPSLSLSPQEILLGSGTADPIIGFRRDSDTVLKLADKNGVERTARVGGIQLVNGNIRFDEISDPGVAPADDAYLFCIDNGAGKTQLAVRFQSGLAIVIATEA